MQSMCRSVLGGLLVVAILGCGGAPTPPGEPAEPVIVAAESVPVPVANEPVLPASTPPPAPAPAPAPAKPEPSRFANDAATEAVNEAMRPSGPAALPLPQQTARPRSSPFTRGELPLSRTIPPAAKLPTVPRKDRLPFPPSGSVGPTVGLGMELDLSEAKLPELPLAKAPPHPKPTAVDVPRLATQVLDRAPVVDPTAEISTERIVQTPLLAPLLNTPFLRLVLPNPFEFREQLPALQAPEFATMPVFVPAAKP